MHVWHASECQPDAHWQSRTLLIQLQVATGLQLITAADACEQVKAAEDQAADRQRDLANMVTEADSFLQQERRSRKAARRCANCPWM